MDSSMHMWQLLLTFGPHEVRAQRLRMKDANVRASELTSAFLCGKGFEYKPGKVVPLACLRTNSRPTRPVTPF